MVVAKINTEFSTHQTEAAKDQPISSMPLGRPYQVGTQMGQSTWALCFGHPVSQDDAQTDASHQGRCSLGLQLGAVLLHLWQVDVRCFYFAGFTQTLPKAQSTVCGSHFSETYTGMDHSDLNYIYILNLFARIRKLLGAYSS